MRNLKMEHLPMRCLTAFAGLFALTIGGMIYVLYRSHSLLVFHIAGKLGLSAWIDHIRNSAPILELPEWVIYSLPGGLWAAAYILMIEAVAQPWPPRKRMLWASSIPLCGIASELLQGIGCLPGIFDPIDALCYAIPLGFYICLMNTFKTPQCDVSTYPQNINNKNEHYE